MKKIYDVAVVGGGPAGLLAGYTAASRGLDVIILEGQEYPGKKLLLTGGGRCNVTNLRDKEGFLTYVPTNARFLQSALSQFSPADLVSFFGQEGLPLVEESNHRMYPASQKSADILRILEKAVHKKDGRIIRFHVKTISDYQALGFSLKNDRNEEILSHSLILATGGRSYPKTGSIGEGYRLARELGHTIIPLRPALVGMNVSFSWGDKLMGISLENVKITLKDSQKKRISYEGTGDIIITHYGLSGPLIMQVSSFINPERLADYTLHISLLNTSSSSLDKSLQTLFNKYQNREIHTAFKEILPSRIIPILLEGLNMDKENKCGQISRESRQNMAKILADYPITIRSLRPIEEATVTGGGVCVKEVNPSTLSSKIRKNLYFAGELLDVDALSGGFNLQIAFSTGFVAGTHILKEEE